MIIRFALINKKDDAGDMEVFLLVAFILLIGPLAVVFGADSRSWDERDQRGWWPGTPRGDPRGGPPKGLGRGVGDATGRRPEGLGYEFEDVARGRPQGLCHDPAIATTGGIIPGAGRS
ncbi:MAG: hypothetical protein ACR2JC_00375 [Chloroflexota bacterium]|nr:MAG: hypothetical protein DLM70_10070 [Chloroflexota bacterium]